MGRLRNIAWRIRSRFASRAIILLYHRVTELASDPQLLSVSRKHFSEHLQILNHYGSPVHLNVLDRYLRNGARKRCAIVVTFDDGYADNLHNAKPLLEFYNTPATVFIATGYLGSQIGFWKDVLDGIFLQPGTLPQTLRLEVVGRLFQWEFGEEAHYTMEAFERHRCWNITTPSDPTIRQRVYRSLTQMLRLLSEDDRRKVLEALITWSEKQLDDFTNHHVLSAEEVIELAKNGLVEIGSHTVSHPVLSALPVAKQWDEIQTSKDRLEKILGSTVTSFAYPYGGSSHYTVETVAAVRRAGFKFACSNFDGMVHRETDMWQLPRFLVRDWDGDEFARRLREWSGF